MPFTVEIKIIKFLIKQGADINKVNKYGETPLFSAYHVGNEAIVKYLVEHGAEIKRKNKKGQTPFLIAPPPKKKKKNEYISIINNKIFR